MINGLGKQLKHVRTILSNDINEIIVCQDESQKGNQEYYTLIRILDSQTIKNILELIYNDDGSCNLPKSLFCGLFVEVNKLDVLMHYRQPRKLFSYIDSDMNSDYSQHIIIKNFLFECLTMSVKYPILDLMLDKENINLDKDYNVFFNGFLDFSKLNMDINELVCVKRCSDLINDILLANEELTDKSDVKAIRLFKKKRRNSVYTKMIQLYNDFKIKEKKYKEKENSLLQKIWGWMNNIYENKLGRLLTICGVVIISLALIVMVFTLFNFDLPFSKYKGMNIIGTVNMTQK